MRNWLAQQIPVRGPARRLGLATLIDTAGTGIYLTTLPLFLIRAVHLPASRVGIGLSVAGGFGLIGGVLVGHLADRFGIRAVLVPTYLVQACAALLLSTVSSFAMFCLAAALGTFAFDGGRALRYTAIARIAQRDRVRTRAQLRAISNTGIAIGTGLGGVIVAVGTRSAYAGGLMVNATSCVLAAAVFVTLPRMDPVEGSPDAKGTGTKPKAALRDLPYLVIVAFNGVLGLQAPLMAVALPLWIATRRMVPTLTVTGVFLTNTLLVILFLVRVSRSVDSTETAGAAWRRCGLALAGGCALIAPTAGMPAVPALCLILMATVVITVGELWYSAGGFELSLGLAPEQAQGSYQGLFNLGEGAATTFGPMLVTALCVTWGGLGWLFVACILAVTGLVTPWCATWAGRRSARQPAMARAARSG